MVAEQIAERSALREVGADPARVDANRLHVDGERVALEIQTPAHHRRRPNELANLDHGAACERGTRGHLEPLERADALVAGDRVAAHAVQVVREQQRHALTHPRGTGSDPPSNGTISVGPATRCARQGR